LIEEKKPANGSDDEKLMICLMSNNDYFDDNEPEMDDSVKQYWETVKPDKKHIPAETLFFINHVVHTRNSSSTHRLPMYQLGGTKYFVPFDYTGLRFSGTELGAIEFILKKAIEADKNKRILQMDDTLTDGNGVLCDWLSKDNNTFRNCKIHALDNYPIPWIVNEYNPELGQKSKLEKKYFEKEVLTQQSTDTISMKDRNLKTCTDMGRSMFDHQKLVHYCLRPYSPIRSLLVNSITGSGKTRMMQSVLENFAPFPNLKIVLFPKAEIRTSFYNNNVLKYSKIYNLDEDNISTTENVRTDGGECKEILDAFNSKFAYNSFGGIERDASKFPSFREYMKKKEIHQATEIQMSCGERVTVAVGAAVSAIAVVVVAALITPVVPAAQTPL
jgi:hypothetical protein